MKQTFDVNNLTLQYEEIQFLLFLSNVRSRPIRDEDIAMIDFFSNTSIAKLVQIAALIPNSKIPKNKTDLYLITDYGRTIIREFSAHYPAVVADILQTLDYQSKRKSSMLQSIHHSITKKIIKGDQQERNRKSPFKK